MTAAALEVRGLCQRYGATAVLHGADLTAHPGEILGLIGPNGAGKTTLLECIAGLLPTTQGTVSAAGRPLAPTERKSALFYVPDAISPFPDQPLRWALSLMATMHGRPGYGAVADELQLTPSLGTRMGQLSKGQRKRALVAFGLLSPQPVLLLDEPFDGLDLRQARQLMAVLRAEAGRGRALVLSIHQLTDAERVCDRFSLLNAGKTVAHGTLPELRARVGAADDRHPLEELFLALT